MNWNSLFWWFWNHIALIPLTVCTFHRFFNTDKTLKPYIVDTIVRTCLFPSVIYYIFDTISILTQAHRFNWCNFGYLMHHIISLFGFREIITLPIFPWFLSAPFALHCLLIMFPEISKLNYIYFGLMLYCMYRLSLQPWRGIRNYYWLLKILTLVMLGPCIILWLNKCKNNMLNVD